MVTPQLLNQYVSSWLSLANSRVHGTTNRRPIDLFNEEQALLNPLLRKPRSTPRREIRPRLLPEIRVQPSNLSAYDELLNSGVSA